MQAHKLGRQGLTLAGLVSQSSRNNLVLRPSSGYIIDTARRISSCSTRPIAHNRSSRRPSPTPPRRPFASVADTTLEDHNQLVKHVSAQVKHFYSQKQKFRINHGSTNSTRQTSKGAHMLDLSALNRVLKVDPEKKTAFVEPNVPMDRLVEATLPYGLVPPVVMEFPGITVGGGYAGTAGESTSFKHGFFNHTIESVEMVLATGEVVKCSATERPDLFWGAAGAVGSLGVTTLVELRLHEAKKFVQTTYHPVSSMREAIETIESATKDPTNDYVDGIMFSATQGAIVTGRMTDTPAESLPIQTFSSAWDPWFYQHVQAKITTSSSSGSSSSPSPPHTEAIPLPEYFFRYDRAGFWVGDMAFRYFSFPQTRLTRWWLDDFLHTRMMYTALHASGQSRRCIIQDLALPLSTAEQFVQYTGSELGIWPLWLCPLRRSPQPTMHPYTRPDDTEMMLNIGVWGFGPDNRADFVAAERALEAKLRELGGMKWLYAQTYYAEDDFWSMFDRKWYDGLREKYSATTLPSVYEKVRVKTNDDDDDEKKISLREKWPWAGFYGIWKAIQSKTYVDARKAAWRTWTKE